MLLVALLVCRINALTAVISSLALVIALGFWFPIGAHELSTMAGQVAGVTLSIVFIMLGGVLLSTQSVASGAQGVMSDWFSAAAGNPERAILLVGLGVTPLIESIIGWGVGIIVSIPLLMRVGLSATRAATVGLLGLMLCPWGSLAPSLLLTELLSGQNMTDIGVWTAIFNLPVLAIFGAVIARVGIGKFSTSSTSSTRRTGRTNARRGPLTPRLAGELAVTILVMWGALWATNAWVTPLLAGIFAGLAGVFSMLGFGRLSGARPPRFAGPELRAFAPYAILITCMLAAIATDALIGLGVWAEFWTSPGLWLMVTAAIAPFIFGLSRVDSTLTLRRGVAAWWPVCLTTMLYVLFGILLTVSGMAGTLADAAATLGAGFVALIPLIGALSGYVTSSNSATAAMMTQAVTHSSVALGTDPAAALGLLGATTGAAVPAAPARIVLAMSLADESRDETGAPARLGRVTGTVLAANAAVLIVLVPAGWALLS